ncbi:hypothetical protein PENSPDRAFT_659906 [Peniophora sp. CONT]|nr:hypothetical protein PENSPDRAFT_659906 [Peniophora sp. CONT]
MVIGYDYELYDVARVSRVGFCVCVPTVAFIPHILPVLLPSELSCYCQASAYPSR